MKISYAFQQELREQTITNRRTRHAQQVSIVRQSDVTDFSSASRPQRATTRERFVSSMKHPSDCNASIHLSPSETAVLRTFLPFPAQVLQTQISRTASGPTSTSSTRARPKKVSTDFGFSMKRRVKKVSQVCTRRTSSGFSAPRVHTLSAASTAGPSRKVDQKVMARKEERNQDPASAQRSKGQRFCSMGR